MCLDKCSLCAICSCPWMARTCWLSGNKDGCGSSFHVSQHVQQHSIYHFFALRIFFHNSHRKPQGPTLEGDSWFWTFEINAQMLWLIWHIHFALSLFHLTVRPKREVLFIYVTSDSLPEGENIPQSSSMNCDKETYLSWKPSLALLNICSIYAA